MIALVKKSARGNSPKSAIVSAIIFNALVIPLLIPLSPRGVRYRPIGASALWRRNLLIYGLGGSSPRAWASS
jgi:K+-transporting ATPase ATPase B chain